MGFLTRDAKGRSPFWIACYRTADGRERRRSTKCVNKAAAREILHGLEAAELLVGGQNATEEQFRSLLREVVTRATGKKFSDPTIREHLATWLEGEKGTVLDSTLERYRQVARDFVSFLGIRAAGRLDAITKDLFLSYRSAMQRAGHSTANINQTFKVLGRPFRVAADERLMQHNPLGAIKHLRGQPSEKGTFTPKQVSALIAAAPDDEWKALVALGFYCGGRLRDLARLTWGAWDRDKQTLTFAQKKTGGVVLIPIHPELVKYLERLPSGIARAPLLPTLSAKSGTGRSGLSMWFRRIMLVAGIQPGVARERAGKAGHSVSKLSFHSLRHSFTSELAKAGVSPEIRQRLTGHADLASHKVYTHHEVSTFRIAISALPALP